MSISAHHATRTRGTSQLLIAVLRELIRPGDVAAVHPGGAHPLEPVSPALSPRGRAPTPTEAPTRNSQRILGWPHRREHCKSTFVSSGVPALRGKFHTGRCSTVQLSLPKCNEHHIIWLLTSWPCGQGLNFNSCCEYDMGQHSIGFHTGLKVVRTPCEKGDNGSVACAN